MTSTELRPSRVVHCTDAIAWLEAQPVLAGSSMITSLPDRSEFPALSLAEWEAWFVRAAALVISRTPSDGVAIFFQTDIKTDGAWVDKGYLCQTAARESGARLLWHKIVCRTPPGSVTHGRPAYSHLLCFSKSLSADLARASADVLPDGGDKTWTRGMGVKACLLACRYVLDQTPTRTVVDPFCGHGTALAVANELGLDAVGVELGKKRARIARGLKAPGFELVSGSDGDGTLPESAPADEDR
jgi:hypothetical protein